MTVKILIVDDHKILSEGLKSLLEQESDYQVIGLAEDGETGIELADKLSPDIIVMDIAMPGINGVEATRQILKTHKKTKVLALSMHLNREYVHEILQAGASGYILKYSAADELIKAIQTILEGQTYLSPEATQIVVDDFLVKKESSGIATLSKRERQVLKLLADGKTTKEIAYTLELSTKTVEGHRKKVMEKCKVTNLVELTKLAIREGITSIHFK
jgi:DNA-binding NarL/FixJ family response regulator